MTKLPISGYLTYNVIFKLTVIDMKTKLFMLASLMLAVVALTASCVQDRIEVDDEKTEPTIEVTVEEESWEDHLLSADEAVSNVVDFLQGFHQSTATRSSLASEVGDVVACKVSDIVENTTRSASMSDRLAFYAVNLRNDKGFVLAAADDRYEPIYAYIEEGSYEKVDSAAGGYKWFLDVLAQRATDPNDSVLLKKTNMLSRNISTVVGPYLTTKWGVNSPYNIHTYNASCTSQGVALAQIASYFEKPDFVSYSLSNSLTVSSSINWSAIMAVNNYQNGRLVLQDSIASQVSHLIRYIEGVYSTETFSSTYYALERMSDAGFHGISLLSIYAFNSDADVRSSLDDGELIYARGSVTPSGISYGPTTGRAWAIDGYNGNKFHCNWGLDGNFDGYFFSSAFAPYPGVTYNYQLAYQPLY